MKRPTQKQRILAVLSDGRWHTSAELYRTGCVLHSRISDLRKDGYSIERRGVAGIGAEAHEYRLERSDEASERSDGLPLRRGSDASSELSGAPAAAVATEGSQLTFTGPQFRRQAA